MNTAGAGQTAELEDDPAQDFQRLLLDQLPIGVFHKDKAGRFTFVNAWYCRFKGVEARAFIGKTADQVAASRWTPEEMETPDRRREIKIFNDGANHHEVIMRTGRSIEVEEQHVDPDGNARFLHVIKGPLLGSDGTMLGSQGVLLDITERKRAEAQYASERELLRTLLDFSSDSIYFKDRESRFLRCSAAMAHLFGVRSPEEMVGKRDFDYFDAEHAEAAFEDEQEIIRSGRPIIGKTEKETYPDGRIGWALTSKLPLHDSQGEVIGTFGTSKDITHFKETEAKLEQLHRELLQTSRQAGMAEVATNVLHNVGNVLNSVNVAAALLLDAARKSKVSSLPKVVGLMNEHAQDIGAFMAADPKGKQLPAYLVQLSDQLVGEQRRSIAELEALQQNIDHIKEIVAMQQSYAKVSGVTEIVSLTDLVEDAARMNSGALARHEVELVRDFADTPPLTVEKHKVLQILVNSDSQRQIRL